MRVLSTEGTIQNSQLQSLWSENTNDFGEIQTMTVENSIGLTELRCSCGSSCSEPLFAEITVQIQDQENTIFYLYEPRGTLGPLVTNECSTFTEAYGENEDNAIYSGLSFVGVVCEKPLFSNGYVVEAVWFEVNSDQGSSVIFPGKETRFDPLQLLLSCGADVTIYHQFVGYSLFGGPPLPSPPLSFSFVVESWNNAQEEDFYEAENIISESPNILLAENFQFSSLQTMSLPCFPPGTFSPFDGEEIVQEILESPIPEDVNQILIEAAILSVVEDPATEVIDRLESYLDVVRETGNSDQIVSLGQSITQTTSNIILESPNNVVLEEIYSLVGELETVLLCDAICGEEATLILSDNIKVGASVDVLENIKTLSIGSLSFELPDNLSELQETLGGEGACVFVGYSLIEEVEQDIPTASLTFYSINCTTGEREDIPITLLTDSFLITIPLEEGFEKKEECGEEEVGLCVSGETLTTATSTSGCELFKENSTHIICECTHLTAFSALFVPGDGSGCNGWEWGNLQTIAASLLAFCTILVFLVCIIQHYAVHVPYYKNLYGTMERQSVVAS